MSWQKCPVCNGSGSNYNNLYQTSGLCSTCNGHGIISALTGAPPAFQKYITSTGTGDAKLPIFDILLHEPDKNIV
jgi:DnaJ-class molecular chaperone